VNTSGLTAAHTKVSGTEENNMAAAYIQTKMVRRRKGSGGLERSSNGKKMTILRTEITL